MKKIISKILFLTMIFPAGLLSGCSRIPDSYKGDWKLMYYQKGENAQMIAAASITLKPAGGKKYSFSGNAGVNNYSGTFEIDGNRNTIKALKDIAATKMMGHPVVQEFEDGYISVLGSADAIQILDADRNPQMVISSSSLNSHLVFIPYKLMGTSWMLSSIKEGKSLVVAESSEGPLTMSFLFDGSCNGSTGINDFQMPVQIDSEKHRIEFSSGAITMQVSADEAATELERIYMKSIADAAFYDVSGVTLTIMDKRKNVLMTFTQNTDFLNLDSEM